VRFSGELSRDGVFDNECVVDEIAYQQSDNFVAVFD
jgi:hypothetical protein